MKPSSSSSSSSASSADSNSNGAVPATFRTAPHSSQLMLSPSSTSSSSTSILPSHTGHSTIAESSRNNTLIQQMFEFATSTSIGPRNRSLLRSHHDHIVIVPGIPYALVFTKDRYTGKPEPKSLTL